MSLEEPIWVDEVKKSEYDLNNLPESIEQEILNYLSVEYAPDFPTSTEISFVGEYTLWGKPIRCWEFGSNQVFASVQPYADGYFIGVISKEVACG